MYSNRFTNKISSNSQIDFIEAERPCNNPNNKKVLAAVKKMSKKRLLGTVLKKPSNTLILRSVYILPAIPKNEFTSNRKTEYFMCAQVSFGIL